MGFRYARVTLTGRAELVAITMVPGVFGAYERGRFHLRRCRGQQTRREHDLVAALEFHRVPTDCPQRDERLGWTGDAQDLPALPAGLRIVNPSLENIFAM